MGTEQTDTKFFAAVGTDGMRPVVWGIGDTEDAATDDARSWDPDGTETLTIHEITEAQAATVMAGCVAWPVIVTDTAESDPAEVSQ